MISKSLDSASEVIMIEYIWQYYVNVLWFLYAVILTERRLDQLQEKKHPTIPLLVKTGIEKSVASEKHHIP